MIGLRETWLKTHHFLTLMKPPILTITMLEVSTGLKITTQPNPQVFKPEPDAAQHTSMNCLPKPSQTCYHQTDSRPKFKSNFI